MSLILPLEHSHRRTGDPPMTHVVGWRELVRQSRARHILTSWRRSPPRDHLRSEDCSNTKVDWINLYTECKVVAKEAEMCLIRYKHCIAMFSPVPRAVETYRGGLTTDINNSEKKHLDTEPLSVYATSPQSISIPLVVLLFGRRSDKVLAMVVWTASIFLQVCPWSIQSGWNSNARTTIPSKVM